MDWYEKAADDFIKLLENTISADNTVKMEIKAIKNLEENDIRFHFGAGMIIRNDLRELGYIDNIYGNLDDHYMEILHLAYKKVGVDNEST